MNQDSRHADAGCQRSEFAIPRMDCPSEENLIRLALGNLPQVQSLLFDLAGRRLTVLHAGDAAEVLARLAPLNLGATHLSSAPVAAQERARGAAVPGISTFAIPKMDCPSEENLIRLALQDIGTVSALNFDLSQRQLRVTHTGASDTILAKLLPLKLGATLVSSVQGKAGDMPVEDRADDASEAQTLWLLLAINGAMFFVELIWGWLAQSTGLIADSLDMFADAAVYGLALYAVGRAAHIKTKAAHMAGWLQLILAIGALTEVVRRAAYGSEPQSALMMGVGAVALVANVACLVLIARKRDRGVHMKASYIFSANDVLANLGVIVAGALVNWTGSPYPDFIIGMAIGLIVMNGARRILHLQ